MPKVGQIIEPPPTIQSYPKNSAAAPAGKPKNYAPIFEMFGVAFGKPNSSGEALAEECPWCGKDRFYLNVEKGQYDCKHCGEQGNVYTFLTKTHRRLFDE